MDCKEPKTRKELNGNKKDKEGKGVYNQKYIRLQEALIEKNKNKAYYDRSCIENKIENNKNTYIPLLILLIIIIIIIILINKHNL